MRRRKANTLWEGLDRKERMRIARGVADGRVFANVEDAQRAYNVARAERTGEGKGPLWWRLVLAAAAFVYLVFEVVLGFHGPGEFGLPTVGAVWASVLLVLEVRHWATRRGRRERVLQAERLNRQVLEAHGIALEEDQPRSSQRSRIASLPWILDLVGVVAGVAAIGVLPENDPGTRADHWRAAGLAAGALVCGLAAALISFRLRRQGLETGRRMVAAAGFIGLALAVLVLFFTVSVLFTGW